MKLNMKEKHILKILAKNNEYINLRKIRGGSSGSELCQTRPTEA